MPIYAGTLQGFHKVEGEDCVVTRTHCVHAPDRAMALCVMQDALPIKFPAAEGFTAWEILEVIEVRPLLVSLAASERRRAIQEDAA